MSRTIEPPRVREPDVRRWGMYRTDDGLFVAEFLGPARSVAANTPQGCAAWPDPDGTLDMSAWRVDGDQLVPWTPVEPVVPPELLAAQIRAERDRRLAACDWVVVRATELAEPVPADWIIYRQALRDVPEQPNFPAAVQWPNAPETA